MFKKALNMVLILITALIYGAIFYKVFWPKKALEITNDYQIFSNNNFLNKNVTAKDTFKFSLPKRDPFNASTKKVSQKKVNSNNTSRNTLRKNLPSHNFTWPKIYYYGFVKNETSESKLVLIKVNNKIFKKREGNIIDGEIKISQAFSDSLIVSLNGINRTYLREQ